MKCLTHDSSDTELAKGFTVDDYEQACDKNPPDRDVIAEAIRMRCTERYIAPVYAKRHGFNK